MAELSTRFTPTPEYRECPWCAEKIMVSAKICRYCNRDSEGTIYAQKESSTDQNSTTGITVGDGVRAGCGAFIILPLLIAGASIILLILFLVMAK